MISAMPDFLGFSRLGSVPVFTGLVNVDTKILDKSTCCRAMQIKKF